MLSALLYRRTHYNLVKEKKDLIQAELDKLQNGLVFSPKLIEGDEDDEMIDGLLSCLGTDDVKITIKD